MTSQEELTTAVGVLSARALEVRAVFPRHEIDTTGSEWTATDLLNGFVVDVGDLTRLVMANTGVRPGPPDLHDALSHELADCLWSVLVLADRLDVDLGLAFASTMDSLERRLSQDPT